tara:strand:- start:45859 stop:46113 length:255 start_codon:yes stop_codon:yes gene_type:complete
MKILKAAKTFFSAFLPKATNEKILMAGLLTSQGKSAFSSNKDNGKGWISVFFIEIKTGLQLRGQFRTFTEFPINPERLVKDREP